MTPEEYKLLQEQYVSGHGGGSALEVHLVTGHAIVSLLTVQCIAKPNKLAEMLLLIVPAILTLCRPEWMPFVLLAQCAFILYHRHILYHRFPRNPNQRKPASSKATKPKLHQLTAFKSTVMLLTAVSILAVDFRAFPRRFAKTEIGGVSVMDAGVGATVVGMGWSRGVRLAGGGGGGLWGVWRRALPVAVVGIARTVAVKLSGYQEHVSEYGVHWNFFLTLSAVIMFGNMAIGVVGGRTVGWLAGVVLVAYEVLLSRFNWFAMLTDNTAPRLTIVEKNKEGLASCIGYTAIYLLSTRIGFGIAAVKDERKLRHHLLALTALLYTLYHALAHYATASRRVANATYCVWVVALCSGHLTAFSWLPSCGSQILDALNRHQLCVFLVANVATGLVNKTVYTLVVEDGMAMAIIFIYAVVVVSVALFLDLISVAT